MLWPTEGGDVLQTPAISTRFTPPKSFGITLAHQSHMAATYSSFGFEVFSQSRESADPRTALISLHERNLTPLPLNQICRRVVHLPHPASEIQPLVACRDLGELSGFQNNEDIGGFSRI
jgi:hypothetical protein